MEWRCEWCGKPHAEDDPPCDNCGHGSFEQAVVPTAPEGDDESGPLVWVCAECGREHPRNNPPCSRCGGMPLEKQRQSFDEDDPLPDEEPGGETVDEMWAGDEDAAVDGETTTVWACSDCGRAHPRNNPPCSRCGGMTFEREERVFDADDDWDDRESTGPDPEVGSDTMTTWVCTECGRSHPRNNPPCSRCGAMSLEQREERFDDVGAGGGGWRSAIDWKVGLGFVGALVLLTLIVGPAMGVFDLPGEGPPAVEGVPGEADSHGGVSLSAVERSFVDQLRAGEGTGDGGELTWNRELAGVATYRNRWTVKTTYTDAERPTPRPLLEAVSNVDSCDAEDVSFVEFDTPATLQGTPTDGFGSADAMAAALVADYAGEDGTVDVAAPAGQAAADVHVGPDGRVFVTVFLC
jgi:ribosomal protein L44E